MYLNETLTPIQFLIKASKNQTVYAMFYSVKLCSLSDSVSFPSISSHQSTFFHFLIGYHAWPAVNHILDLPWLSFNTYFYLATFCMKVECTEETAHPPFVKNYHDFTFSNFFLKIYVLASIELFFIIEECIHFVFIFVKLLL